MAEEQDPTEQDLALIAKLRKLPSEAEYSADQIQEALVQLTQSAEAGIRQLADMGVTDNRLKPRISPRRAVDWVGVGFGLEGELSVWLEEGVREFHPYLQPFVEALALAWRAGVWARGGLLVAATRALLVADKQLAIGQGCIAKSWRVKAAREAAKKRHNNHVATKVKPYREEYLKRLKAGEKSADIIADMAKKYGYSVVRVRRIIQPRRQQC